MYALTTWSLKINKYTKVVNTGYVLAEKGEYLL